MAHKKGSSGTSKYAMEHRYEKNKIKKIEKDLARNPNNPMALKRLAELKEILGKVK